MILDVVMSPFSRRLARDAALLLAGSVVLAGLVWRSCGDATKPPREVLAAQYSPAADSVLVVLAWRDRSKPDFVAHSDVLRSVNPDGVSFFVVTSSYGMWHRAVSSLLTLQLHESQVRRFSGQLPIVVVGTPTDAIRFCWHLRSCRFKDVSWCAYSDQAGWFHDHPDFLVKLQRSF